jgi:hypothetical protein
MKPKRDPVGALIFTVKVGLGRKNPEFTTPLPL